MKLFVFFTFLLHIATSFGQDLLPDSLFPSQSGRYNLGGQVAYFFWEEDSLGKIISGSIQRPFKRNEIIVLNHESQENEKLSIQRVINAVSTMSHQNNNNEKRFFKAEPPLDGPDLLHFALRKRPSDGFKNVFFKKKNGIWQSYTRKNVLYFNVYADSTKSYSHANDSVILKKYNVARLALGHYMVKTFWDDKQQIVSQQVFAYNGEDVSDYFINAVEEFPCRVLIFSNGYRGPKRNKDISDHLITKRDRFRYWMKLDKLFIQRIFPDEYFYIDGNHQIGTSNHRSMSNFSLSYSRIKALRKKEKNAQLYSYLNTSPNVEGFLERKEKGVVAAKAYLALRCNSPTCLEVRDTIDVVSHSMGYAYSLGFVETLKDYVVFGNMYIIAPENACTGGTDWSVFEEVWQYGSNLGEPNADPVWEQDGIAPQCKVKDLDSAKIGGRVFLPKDLRKKNFIDSHMLKQYHWIITDLKPGDPGYVK